MSATVSARWYFPDWMSDPEVRSCSLGARGLWMDILCIAGVNRGKEHGFLLISGRKPTSADISRILGASVIEVETLLKEIVDRRVCSVDRRGVIYCRRMVRAEKYRGNGRLGTPGKVLSGNENKKAPPPPKPIPKPVPLRKEPEAGLPLGTDAADWPEDYRETFWRLYPRRTEKKSAMAKLEAIKRGGAVRWHDFLTGVERYALHVRGTEERYIKHPTTWLNRGCWDDELPSNPQPPRNGGGGNAWAQMARRNMEEVE